MPKTLYEILEVHPNASLEAIHAAYQRLSSKFDPASPGFQIGTDAQAQSIAIREAHGILGDPEKRKKYDDAAARNFQSTLPSGSTSTISSYEFVEESGWTSQRILMVALVFVIAGATYLHFQRNAEERQLEQQRLTTERQRAAQAAEEQRTRQLQMVVEEREKAIQSQRERQDLQRFNQEVNQRERELSYAHQNEQRRREAEAQRMERTRVAQEREAYNRGQAEQAEVERRMRQREYEDQNQRPRVIVIPHTR